MEQKYITIGIISLIIGLVVGVGVTYVFVKPEEIVVEAEEKPIIISQIRDPGDPNHVVLRDGARRFAEMKDLEFVDLVHGGDEELAMTQLAELTVKYDPERLCFMSVPNSMGHFSTIAEFCEEHHIYWAGWYGIPLEFPAEDYPYLVCANTSPAYDGGWNSAKGLVEAMGGSGNIVFVSGGVGHHCIDLRTVGMLDYIETQPDVHILDGGFHGWLTEESLAAMETYITVYGDEIDGVWGGFNSPSLGALEACRRAGLNVPISTIDATPELVDHIIEGKPGEEPYICCAWNNITYWCGMANAAKTWMARTTDWYPELEYKAFEWAGYIVDESNAETFYAAEFGYPKSDYDVVKYPYGPDYCFVNRPYSTMRLAPTPEQQAKLTPWIT